MPFDPYLRDPGGWGIDQFVPLGVSMSLGSPTVTTSNLYDGRGNPFRIYSDQERGFAGGFSFGPGGGGSGPGSGGVSAQPGAVSPYGTPSYLSGTGPQINAVTQPSWGGTLTAGGGSGGFLGSLGQWAQNNPQWVGAVLGGVSGGLQGSQGYGGGTSRGNSSSSPYMAETLDPHLRTILEAQAGIFAGSQGGGGGGGGGGMPNFSQVAPDRGAVDMLTRAGNAGLDFTANDPFMQAGLSGVQALLGAQGASGMAGYNPAAEALMGRLGGVGLDMPTNYLQDFIGQGYGTQAPGGTLGGGGGSFGGGGSYLSRPGVATAGGGGGSGGGVVPDASGYGLFGTQVREIFDDEANEQVLSDLISSVNEDALDAHYRALADLDVQAQSGPYSRLGSGWYNAARSGQQSALDRATAGTSAQIRYEDLNNRRLAELQALGLVNTRDLGAMADATQRYGIQSSANSAAAGHAAALEAARMQHALGLRGQDLDAIGMMQQGQLAGLGLMGNLAGMRSGDFGAGLGAAQGFGGLGLQGVGLGLGSGQALSGHELGLGQLGLGHRQIGAQQAANAQSAQQRALDSYLRTVGVIGGMGGTTTGSQTTPSQGGGNALGGALQGAIGGYLRGLYR